MWASWVCSGRRIKVGEGASASVLVVRVTWVFQWRLSVFRPASGVGASRRRECFSGVRECFGSAMVLLRPFVGALKSAVSASAADAGAVRGSRAAAVVRPMVARSALQWPAVSPAARWGCQAGLVVEDFGAFRYAYLADDRAGGGGYHPYLAIVSTAEGTYDVAELGGVGDHTGTVAGTASGGPTGAVAARDQADRLASVHQTGVLCGSVR
jgi:hypothetical protein